jgi:pentatricopeptide repeat protein
MFGPLVIEVNGTRLQEENWKSKKALTLFKYLSAKLGEKVPNEVLIELLWPDNEGIDSSHNLHAIVYLARKALLAGAPPSSCKKSCIRHSGGLYWLDPACVAFLDVHEFEEHVKKSRSLSNEHPQAALDSCESALKLYRGDFLPEDPYDDWTIPYREHYRELYVDVSLRAAELLTRCRKDYDSALRICRKALEIEPYREDCYHALISTLIKAGHFSEAITAYKEYSEMIQQEFGLNPSPSIRNMIHHMRSSLVDTRLSGELAAGLEYDSDGAFVCDKASFKSIVTLEERRLDRHDRPLCLISIDLEQSDCSEENSGKVLSLVRRCLRKGDAVCAWSPGRILVLLPTIEPAGVSVVTKRLEQELRSNFAGTFEISSKIISQDDKTTATNHLLA